MIVHFSLREYHSSSDLLEAVREGFDQLKKTTSGDVTMWLDIARSARQPQVFWLVDYLEPREELLEINDLIRQSEIILYGSKTSIELKDNYKADLAQQEAFHTIRMHLRSEENDIASALIILKQMLLQLEEDLSLIRKSNLLVHACLAFLCCKMFEESYDAFERHWALTKYASNEERIDLGLTDNQVILQMAIWFFTKYSPDFRDFCSIRTSVKPSSIWSHKKIPMLHFLEYDCAWIASFCGLPFYNEARKWCKALPAYERKRSTPTNYDKTWPRQDILSYGDTQATGPEKYYFEEFNREINPSVHYTDQDKADNYLYSFYHYQTDYAEESSKKRKLLEFLKQHVNYDEINSVVEAGSGIEPALTMGTKQRYLAIDISEKVCEILFQQNINHLQKPISLFMKETEEKFDLCFACDILSNLQEHRINIFLDNCSQKCKFLAALIDTRNDCRTDILSAQHHVKEINLHRTVMSPTDWIPVFNKYFVLQHTIEGPWIYLIGISRRETNLTFDNQQTEGTESCDSPGRENAFRDQVGVQPQVVHS